MNARRSSSTLNIPHIPGKISMQAFHTIQILLISRNIVLLQNGPTSIMLEKSPPSLLSSSIYITTRVCPLVTHRSP